MGGSEIVCKSERVSHFLLLLMREWVDDDKLFLVLDGFLVPRWSKTGRETRKGRGKRG